MQKVISNCYALFLCNLMGDFKLQAKTIHERFQSEYLPYILEQVTQQKKEHVESEIEKRLKKEMKNLKDTNKKLDEKIVKLNQ